MIHEGELQWWYQIYQTACQFILQLSMVNMANNVHLSMVLTLWSLVNAIMNFVNIGPGNYLVALGTKPLTCANADLLSIHFQVNHSNIIIMTDHWTK